MLFTFQYIPSEVARCLSWHNSIFDLVWVPAQRDPDLGPLLWVHSLAVAWRDVPKDPHWVNLIVPPGKLTLVSHVPFLHSTNWAIQPIRLYAKFTAKKKKKVYLDAELCLLSFFRCTKQDGGGLQHAASSTLTPPTVSVLVAKSFPCGESPTVKCISEEATLKDVHRSARFKCEKESIKSLLSRQLCLFSVSVSTPASWLDAALMCGSDYKAWASDVLKK